MPEPETTPECTESAANGSTAVTTRMWVRWRLQLKSPVDLQRSTSIVNEVHLTVGLYPRSSCASVT